MERDTIQRLEGGHRVRGEHRAEPPLVSIIAVLFRDREECIRLLKNISAFDPREFELIVIDGGSDDGTVEVLREWDDKIDYWLSEPDSGIYDAMNKGIAAARGEYVLHLNAGDALRSIPSETLAACLKEQVDIATFRVSIDGERNFCPSNDGRLKVRNTFHHQGTFYRRASLPLYDTRYKVYADFDLNQRVVMRGAKVRIFDDVVAVHSTAGISNTAASAESELYKIVLKNHGWLYVVLLWIQQKWDGIMVRLGRPPLKV